MRISINDTFNPGQPIFFPTDPFPLEDIDTLFSVDLFQASTITPKPFNAVRFSWRISTSRTNNNAPDDFEFRVVEVAGRFLREILFHDIELIDDGDWVLPRTADIQILGRRKVRGSWTRLGPVVSLTVDDADCRTQVVDRLLLDPILLGRFQDEVLSDPRLRLRRETRPRDPNLPQLGYEEITLEPRSSWPGGVIRYDFPLEVVLNNFFNMDLDLSLEIRLRVANKATESILEVEAKMDSDADFSTFEDIVSLGSATVVARTVDRMMPLVLDARKRDVEEGVATALLGLVRQSERLLSVDISSGDFGQVIMQLCPPPEQPVVDEDREPVFI